MASNYDYSYADFFSSIADWLHTFELIDVFRRKTSAALITAKRLFLCKISDRLGLFITLSNCSNISWGLVVFYVMSHVIHYLIVRVYICELFNLVNYVFLQTWGTKLCRWSDYGLNDATTALSMESYNIACYITKTLFRCSGKDTFWTHQLRTLSSSSYYGRSW